MRAVVLCTDPEQTHREPGSVTSLLIELGFRMGVYGISLLLHSVRTMQGILSKLKADDLSFIGKGAGFDEFKSIVGFEKWASIEGRQRDNSGR